MLQCPRAWQVGGGGVQQEGKMNFHRVVGGDKGEDPRLGQSYHFIIDASNGNGKDRKYDAVLVEQVWLDKSILISFKPKNLSVFCLHAADYLNVIIQAYGFTSSLFLYQSIIVSVISR
ncbi:hypothetical protein SETIT_9G182000v2 [Setaria italica]|uniref:Cystatin domain-containing protein n=1 Tax=Setaria italica TaxID=4555 RepID=A0A368SHX1_SETIT|nr:hypothetical protein SETIT_9G182000v2 [Setaria italica]